MQEESSKLLPYEEIWVSKCLRKKISHLNVLKAISKFYKPDLETTMVNHYIISQYGTNKGIKLFDDCVVRASRKEIDQIHNRKVFQPRLPRYLNCSLPSKVNGKCVYKVKCLSRCIIYEVKCSMCEAIYIGNTQQTFKK